MGPILLNSGGPADIRAIFNRGRGILISAHLSRATRGTIGRLQAQTFRDFLRVLGDLHRLTNVITCDHGRETVVTDVQEHDDSGGDGRGVSSS